MSWIAFILLLVALGWLSVGCFQGYIREKKMSPELPEGAGIMIAGLWLGLLIVLVYYYIVQINYCWILIPSVFISGIGFLEDSQKITARARLIFQVMAIYVGYYFIDLDVMNLNIMGLNVITHLSSQIPYWGILSLLVLGILWMSQVMDRMDKMDGLVATQSLFVFGVGGFILYDAGAYDLAILTFGLCSLMTGFAIWNWPVAKVVMGKSGTLFLGVLLSFIALYSYQWFYIPLEIWLILMAPFLVDASLTVIRQMIARENFLELSSNHAYQRLLQIGWSPEKLLCGLIIINSGLAALAFWGYKEPVLLPVFTASSIGLILIIYGLIEYSKPMYRNWYQSLSAQLNERTK